MKIRIIVMSMVLASCGESTVSANAKASSQPTGRMDQVGAALVKSDLTAFKSLVGENIVYIMKERPKTPSLPVGKISSSALVRELAKCSVTKTIRGDEIDGGAVKLLCGAETADCPRDTFIVAAFDPAETEFFIEYLGQDASKCAPLKRFKVQNG